MLRILWSYIDCVSTLQLWRSHVLSGRKISPRKYAVCLWGGVVCVERRSNRVTVPQFHWVLIFTSPTYSWTKHIPLVDIVYPRDNTVHSRTTTWFSTRPVKVKQGRHQRIYIQKCYYVFVNVRKATSYVIGKLIASSSMGYYIRLFLYSCNYNIFTIVVFANRTIRFSFHFAKYSFITKYCMLSQFGNATWNVLPMFIFCSLSSSSPSRRLSLSIAKVIFQEQST